MFHIIANFSANSDGRNQTQNCSFNTSHTGILFTKYRSKFLIFKLHKLLWKKYKLRSLSKLLDCGQRLSKECKNLKGIILIFWNTIFRETHRLDHEHSPTPPRPNIHHRTASFEPCLCLLLKFTTIRYLMFADNFATLQEGLNGIVALLYA